MSAYLLYNDGGRPFDFESIRRIFESEQRFQNIRHGNLVGSVLEAEYFDLEDSTIVRLNENLNFISLSRKTDAALSAALVLQSHLDEQLHMIDLEYTFDVIIKEFGNLDNLRRAVLSGQGG